MSMHRKIRFLKLDYVAVLFIVIAFFIISHCGFFLEDDLYMNYGVSSLMDVLKQTKKWYFRLGGRIFSVASQYLFSGALGNNKIWFDIVNTIFFASFILICGRLINKGKTEFVSSVLLFALLFWFLCPVPEQTLFWVAGSTTYLWANTLSFAFLLIFQKRKDDNFSVVRKLGLFLMSFIAATEFITCASICGAFVVYYALHIKKFKGNAVPMVIGYALGSMVLLFAPGSIGRADMISYSVFDNIHYLTHNLFQEIIRYKALWLFLIVFVWGWIRNKSVVNAWAKHNSILLLSLVWSVIAFSVVFRPGNRALFFTEALSLVLFLKFLFDTYGFIKIRFIDDFIFRNSLGVRNVLLTLLFVMFMLDSVFAVIETKKQKVNNDVLLNEIVESGGVVALDRMHSSHRMASAPSFPKWTWKYLAHKYNLDTVRIYPSYCLEKYYNQPYPLENVYVDANDYGYKCADMVVRVEKDIIQEPNNHVIFTIEYYKRPRNWLESLLDKWRNYHYDLVEIIEKDKPTVCFEDYCYYVFHPRRVDAENLKSVRCRFK